MTESAAKSIPLTVVSGSASEPAALQPHGFRRA